MLSDCHVYPTLAASDMARARQFYEQTLGFKPTFESAGGVMYDACGSRFFVYPSQFSGGNQATYMGFEVDDLRKMVDELISRGVKFEDYDVPGFKTDKGIVETPDGPGAWLKDTEGNIIGLFQPVQKVEWPREMVSAGRSA